MSAIDVVPVSGLASFLAFCRMPRTLYSGHPGFAPSLDAERWTLYAHWLNPHFKQVTSQAWLARRGGRGVGRIAAQVYRPEITPLGASRAQFGSLDTIDDRQVVAALTASAEAWLREHGTAIIHGPFSPSVNSETGLLVQGFDAVPMMFMPWHPPYLGPLLEACGYGKARDLISYRYRPTKADARDSGVTARPEWRDRLKIRPLRLKDIRGEAVVITGIFNDAWSDNWGYVPLTVDELVSTAEALKFVMPEDFGFVFELDGEPAAFGIGIPNLHEMTADLKGRLFPFGLRLIGRVRNARFKTARIALFGVRKKFQRSATGGFIILGLVDRMRQLYRTYNLEQIEFGWVLEDNAQMRRPIELGGAQVDKVHRVYEKQLVAPTVSAKEPATMAAGANSEALTRGLELMNRPMDISEATLADRSHIERRREILKAHPEIRTLIGRDRTTAWITICVVAGQLCLAALFGGLGLHYLWLALIGAYCIGAFANHAMFVVIHDAIHNLVFKDGRLNKLTAILADLPNAFPTSMGFRAYHIKHHSHLSSYDYDADVPSDWEARLVGNRWYMKAGWLFFFAAFQWLRISRLKGTVPGIFSRWSIINIGAVIVCDLVLLFFFGPNALLYLLASFWFSVGLHPLGARWIQEHYALAPGQGTFDYYGPLNRIQLNIGYHNEHHDFPDIPWSRLPELKAMAPEYYDGLHAHYSWTRLFFAFIFDRRYSLHTRTENMPQRPERQDGMAEDSHPTFKPALAQR